MALLCAIGNHWSFFFSHLPWMGCFFPPLRWRQVSIIKRGHGLASPGVKTWFCHYACGLISWSVGWFISWIRQWGLAVCWPEDSFAKQLIDDVLLKGWLVWPWFDMTNGTLFDSWLISGLVDRSCRLVRISGLIVVLVSSRPHSTGHSCHAVQLPAGPRRLWLVHRRPLRPEVRS